MAGNGTAVHFARQIEGAAGPRLVASRVRAKNRASTPRTWARVESSTAPPTENRRGRVDLRSRNGAAGSPSGFPSRGWSEVPATFRSWPDSKSARPIRTWKPGIIDGLVQTEEYARALIAVQLGAPPRRSWPRGWRPRGTAAPRASARGPAGRVDHRGRDGAVPRGRYAGRSWSPSCATWPTVAARPQVTLTRSCAPSPTPLTPAVLVLADDAAWCEHLVAGGRLHRARKPLACLAQRCRYASGPSATVPSESLAMIEGRRRYGRRRKSTYSDGNGGDPA